MPKPLRITHPAFAPRPPAPPPPPRLPATLSDEDEDVARVLAEYAQRREAAVPVARAFAALEPRARGTALMALLEYVDPREATFVLAQHYGEDAVARILAEWRAFQHEAADAHAAALEADDAERDGEDPSRDLGAAEDWPEGAESALCACNGAHPDEDCPAGGP